VKPLQLEELAVRPDHQIGLTDIPEIDAIPRDAVIGKFTRPPQTRV
jgi:hypothetical protein